MLFHPRKPINLFVTELHGVFPRRKGDIAQKLGHIVAHEFLSAEAIASQLNALDNQQKIKDSIGRRIEARLKERAEEGPKVIRLMLTEGVITKLRLMVEREIEKGIPHWLDELSNDDRLQKKIQALVEEKIQNFSETELESLLFKLIKKELRFLEIWGAILGFIIGCFQLVLFMLG